MLPRDPWEWDVHARVRRSRQLRLRLLDAKARVAVMATARAVAFGCDAVYGTASATPHLALDLGADAVSVAAGVAAAQAEWHTLGRDPFTFHACEVAESRPGASESAVSRSRCRAALVSDGRLRLVFELGDGSSFSLAYRVCESWDAPAATAGFRVGKVRDWRSWFHAHNLGP
jgi:hypothetical protein